MAEFLFNSRKQITKKIIPYTVVIGVAIQTKVRDVSGNLDIMIDTGIRMQNAEVIPWIITGILFPQPLKYPILLKSTQISYELISEQFNLGMKNTIELLTEKNNLLQAQQEQLQAKYMAILNTQLLKFYQGDQLAL